MPSIDHVIAHPQAVPDGAGDEADVVPTDHVVFAEHDAAQVVLADIGTAAAHRKLQLLREGRLAGAGVAPQDDQLLTRHDRTMWQHRLHCARASVRSITSASCSVWDTHAGLCSRSWAATPHLPPDHTPLTKLQTYRDVNIRLV